MALTSTLFTGLSGLEVNQTRLNVVGNNIANVNTVAFDGQVGRLARWLDGAGLEILLDGCDDCAQAALAGICSAKFIVR